MSSLPAAAVSSAMEVVVATIGEAPRGLAGPFQSKMILVVDSHSKWIEGYPTNSSTSSKVIELSRTLIAQFGLPKVLVTDNGSCFVSEEFEMFCLKN